MKANHPLSSFAPLMPLLLLLFVGHRNAATPSPSMCDTLFQLQDDSVLRPYVIDPTISYMAFTLNSTHRFNSLLSVKVFAGYGSPKLGVYATAVPHCPAPPLYPGYAACCGRVEENTLRTNDEYNIVVQAAPSSGPVYFQLRVCADAASCPSICPSECNSNGWCNTTSKACTCDTGYIGNDCAVCPNCGNNPPPPTTLYMGVFTTIGMAVLVVGIVPLFTIIGIISAIVFYLRKRNKQYAPLLPPNPVFTPAAGSQSPVLYRSTNGLSNSTVLYGSTNGLSNSTVLSSSGVLRRSSDNVLYRSSENTVMYSPTPTGVPRRYVAVPVPPGPDGTQIFQLDETP